MLRFAFYISILPAPATSTATSIFNGHTGTYDITFIVVPENDGRPVIKLFVGSVKIFEELLPVDVNYFNSNTTRLELSITGVAIKNGDEIKIEGTSASSTGSSPNVGVAFARVDKIVFACKDCAVANAVSGGHNIFGGSPEFRNPNPINSSVRLGNLDHVELFTSSGRLVSAGKRLNSGVYFVRFTIDGKVGIRKVVVVE